VDAQRAPEVDDRLVELLSEAFAHLGGADARIDAHELQKALGLRSEYLAKRVLALFDRDGNGHIERDEFLDRVRGLIFGTPRQKLRFVFRLHDHDGDGFITRTELYRMVSLSLAEDGVELRPEMVERLVNTLFFDADTNRDGSISFEELEQLVSSQPALLEQITRSEAKWIAPNEDLLLRLDRPREGFWRRLAGRFEGRGLFLFWALLWALANAALFANAVMKYRAAGANELVQIARGGGACLNFNGALILLPMMRRLWTMVRKTFVADLMPVDESIDIHRVIGHAMFGFALLHTAAHLTNYALGTKPFVAQLFMTKAGLTGFVLLLVFAPMWFCSREAVRRSGRFELFHFTHLLYLAWFALALVHGPVFWIWAGVPIAGYVVERLLRRLRRSERTEVLSANALRSGVTRLEIRRPEGFRHRAGDYLFLRIPALARFEWHPFTISSAPERDNVTVHVRSLGNWTSALRRLAMDKHERGDTLPFTCYLDGPYGTPSNHIFESKRVVLLGAGIGVTPFAAILESILMRAYGHGAAKSQLERVHFVWLARDQFSFEWFGELLARLEVQDKANLLDIHIYMTDGRNDITSGALTLARTLLHAKGHGDIVTGLRTQTKFGFPKWDELFGAMAKEQPGDPVDLYFCGPAGLGTIVRDACHRQGMRFRMEHF
jgi:NADPH oxidase 5